MASVFNVVEAFVLLLATLWISSITGQSDLFDPSQLQSLISRAVQEDGVVNPSLLLHGFIEDPLSIPDFNFSSSGSFTDIEGQLKNAKLFGMRQLQIQKILVNVGQMNVSVIMSVPSLRMEGDYELIGYVTVMNVDGGGEFWMNVTDFKAFGKTSLFRSSDGIKVKDIDIDATVEDIQLHFENLLGGGGWAAVSNAILNQLSGVIFDQVRATALDELKTTMEKEINIRLQEIPQGFLAIGSNNTIFDDMLTKAGEQMESMGAEPLHLPDLDETFNKRMFFVETTGKIRLFDGILHGLSTIYRTGDVIIDYENNSVSLIISVGFHNLTGSYNWNAHFMGIGPTGKLTLSMNKLSAFLSISQEMKTGSRPKIQDLKLDRIGQIWLDVDGLGTLDFLLEIVINLVSNALKHNIAKAVLAPVREAVQLQLDNFPMEFITAR